jgi:triosephosphate isomerase
MTAIVGHSERRQPSGETDESAACRALAALDGRLRRDACVGETEDERERCDRGGSPRQVSALAEVGILTPSLSYAGWAIGTGKTATPKSPKRRTFIKGLWPGRGRPLRRFRQA